MLRFLLAARLFSCCYLSVSGLLRASSACRASVLAGLETCESSSSGSLRAAAGHSCQLSLFFSSAGALRGCCWRFLLGHGADRRGGLVFLQACPRAEVVLESTFCTQYKITKRLGLYLKNLYLDTMKFVLGRRPSFTLEGLAADGSRAVVHVC